MIMFLYKCHVGFKKKDNALRLVPGTSNGPSIVAFIFLPDDRGRFDTRNLVLFGTIGNVRCVCVRARASVCMRVSETFEFQSRTGIVRK